MNRESPLKTNKTSRLLLLALTREFIGFEASSQITLMTHGGMRPCIFYDPSNSTDTVG